MSEFSRFKEINALLASGHAKEAQRQLRNLQAHFIALSDEVERLHSRIGFFEEMLSIPQKVITLDGFPWLETEHGRLGPFCPSCHEAEGSLIRLRPYKEGWRCPCCSTEYDRHGPQHTGARILFFPGSEPAFSSK